MAKTQYKNAGGNNAETTRNLAESRPLGRNNFILMAIAGGMIILGFLLMLGGSSTEEAFNPDIFSTRRIIVGPTIAFIGFIFMGFGIIRKPKTN